MKLTAIAIIALVLCSAQGMRLPSMRGTISSTTLVENDVMNALKKHDNDLSKQIQSLISLSLAQGQYDQIFEVLGEILDDLRSDRSAELTAHGVTVGTIQQEIDAFALAWGNARTAADTAQALYSSLHTQIQTLDAQLRQLEEDIVTTTNLIETTHQQEVRDQEATRVRAANHQSTMNALDIIIDDLKSIQTNGSSATTFAEIKEVVARMKKIGNSNPLLSLVEFSTTFDEATLADVIEKLEAIRTHCQGSMEDDAADQVASTVLYNTLIGTYEASLVTMQAEHTKKTTTRAQKQVAYDDAFATWESEEAKYTLNHGLWEDAKAAMVAEVARHDAVMLKINSEIDTVETAISILSNSLGYVQDEMNQDETYRTDLD